MAATDKPIMTRTKTLLLLTILQVTLVHLDYCLCAKTRLRNTLDVKFNADCQLPECSSTKDNESAVNLFQVTSSNPEKEDKTNFIWSNIGGPPMVITSSSIHNSKLEIDWPIILGKTNKPDNKTSCAFCFNQTQDNSIGLLIEKITFFDDVDKTGRFTKDKKHIDVEWSDIIWDSASRTTYHKDELLKTMLRMKPKYPYKSGSILIRLAIPRDHKADRQREVPHLKLNSKSISMVVVVDGIQIEGFQYPRLAMTFVVVVQSPGGEVALDTDSESLISDEFSPGVFRIKSLQFKTKQPPPQPKPQTESAPQTSDENRSDIYAELSNDSDTSLSSTPAPEHKPAKPVSDKLGFLYWKEVAYTDRRKIVSRTVDVVDSHIPMDMSTLSNISKPFYYFFNHTLEGSAETSSKPEYKLYRFLLTFGKGEVTYSVTNFTDFSFVFGLGAAPQEQLFSIFVRIIIFVCFCLPIFVMVTGLSYMMFKKFNRSGDTELLLASET